MFTFTGRATGAWQWPLDAATARPTAPSNLRDLRPTVARVSQPLSAGFLWSQAQLEKVALALKVLQALGER